MEFAKIKINDKGMITIPSKIRKELGISSGDRLTLTSDGDSILFEKTKTLDDIIGIAKNSNKKSTKAFYTEDDIGNAIAQGYADRMKEKDITI